MSTMSKDSIKVFIILLVLATSLGCITGIDNSGHQGTPLADKPDGEPSPPVDVEFFFSEDPKLNKEVTLTLKAIPNEIVEYAELGINLPDGFMLVGREGKWTGALKPGEPQSISVKVKAIREGRWEPEGTIYGYFKYPEGVASGYNLYFTPHLYVYIKGDVVQVSNIPPPNNWVNRVGPSGSLNDTSLSSNLSLSEPPTLGKEVVLSYVANTSVHLDNAQVSVVFPEKGMEMVNITSAVIEQLGHVTRMNLELIEGTQQYNWRGFVPGNSTIRVAMTVKTTLTGEGYVYATTGTIGGDPIAQTVVLYIKVDEFSGSYNVRKG